MDIATVVGLLAGIFFTIYGVYSSGGVIASYINIPSIIITLGGTLASTLMSYPLKSFLNLGNVIRNAFKEKDFSPNKIIEEIINLANVARKEGLLSLEEYGEKINDDFLKKGILLIVDGTDPELVRNIMETELTFLEDRHAEGQRMLESAATFAPAFGMIGTLVGLINMLRTLSDPSTVGPQMSVALVTTYYGSILANVVFLPMANKLKIVGNKEVLVKELIIEGLLAIQAGENPRIIEEKLKTFVSPQMRKNYREQEQLRREGVI
ncbi:MULTISPECIES: motility protein A [Tissierellales]|uniref:Motility protein A n=1 Tax=Acidilutibacter cellobiosedens TaxID=2507161 RepID=A0A410QCM6_9FIRM|nr:MULTISPECIES: motility protein A [Tissierellales]MBE6081752.1 motility protein A [Tissierellaceae bacterium]QAT61614.1 motility protein A [Acidilutibacter cellobiosedens]SCL83094.1 Chemotaxis protein PomA [Sporanaerobacter sp. PP17-6a]